MLYPRLYRKSIEEATRILIESRRNIRNEIEAYFYLVKHGERIPILNYDVVKEAFKRYKEYVLKHIIGR